MARRYGSLTRVSTGKQSNKISPENQKRQCEAFGNAQGWEFYDAYHDTISGTVPITQRKAVMRLLEDVKDGKVTDVIIHEIDRAAREDDVFDELLNAILDSGAFISIADKGVTYSDYDELLYANFWEMNASKYARKTILRKSKQNTQLAIELGSYPQKPRLGWSLERVFAPGTKTKISVPAMDPISGPKVIEAFELYVEGKLSNLNIVRYLNEKYPDAVTFKSHTFAHSLLPNAEEYASGQVTVKLDYFMGKGTTKTYQFPPLISQDLIGQVLAKRATKTKAYSNSNRPFLRVLRCAGCGKAVAYNATLKQFYCNDYMYSHGKRQAGQIKNATACNKSIGLTAITKFLINFLEEYPMGSISNQFEAAVAETVKDCVKLRIMIASGNDNLEDLKAKRNKVIRNLAVLEDIDEATQIEVNKQIKHWQDMIDNQNESSKEIREKYQKAKSVIDFLGINLEEIGDLRFDKDVYRDWEESDGVFGGVWGAIEHREAYAALIRSKSYKVNSMVQELKASLIRADFETVNDLMLNLGMRIEIDFREQDRIKRREGLRLEFDFEFLRGLLPGIGNSETPCTTSIPGVCR